MVGTVTDHGTHLAELVDVPRRMRQELGDPLAGLAMLPPVPRAGHEFIAAMIEDSAYFILMFLKGCRDWLAVELLQQRFVIEEIEAAGAAILKQENHLPSAGSDLGEFGCERREISGQCEGCCRGT